MRRLVPSTLRSRRATGHMHVGRPTTPRPPCSIGHSHCLKHRTPTGVLYNYVDYCWQPLQEDRLKVRRVVQLGTTGSHRHPELTGDTAVRYCAHDPRQAGRQVTHGRDRVLRTSFHASRRRPCTTQNILLMRTDHTKIVPVLVPGCS